MSTTRSAAARTQEKQPPPEQQGGQGQNQNIPATEEEYGDMHKIVLQGLIAAGVLDGKGVKALFTSACNYLKSSPEEREYRTSMEYVSYVVKKINEQLKPLELAIKSASCEVTGKKYFLLITTAEKSIVKSQAVFSKTEIEMFQICLERILRDGWHYRMSLNDAINVLHEIDPRSPKQHGYDFIHRLMDLHYFMKWPISNKEDEYDICLGVRGIREFEHILSDLYQDVVRSCFLCKTLLINGYYCPACKILVHKPCYDKYKKSSEVCPCGASWKDTKIMVKRSKIMDEAIKEYGKGVDLSLFKHHKEYPTMPSLQAQESSRRKR